MSKRSQKSSSPASTPSPRTQATQIEAQSNSPSIIPTATTPYNSPQLIPQVGPNGAADFSTLYPNNPMYVNPTAAHNIMMTPMYQHHMPSASPLHAQPYPIFAQSTAPVGMQAIYATPAAWHKQREYLMQQPTPQAIADFVGPYDGAGGNGGIDSVSDLLRNPASPFAAVESSNSNKRGKHNRASTAFALSSTPVPNPTTVAGGAPSSMPTSPATLAQSLPLSSGAVQAAASSNRLARIQASWRHLKKLQLMHEEEKASVAQKSRIQQTFLQLSSGLIVVFVVMLCYYDYLILAPHLHALFWSFLFWILLYTPQRWLLKAFAWIDEKFLDKYAKTLSIAYSLSALVLGFWFRQSLSTLIIIAIAYAVSTFFLFGDRHTLSALCLLFIILLLLAFPLFLFTKNIVFESQEIAARLRNFIESNTEFQHILEDFSTSSTFLWLQNYCRRWGYEIPQADVSKLRELILKSLVQFADQLTTVLTSVYGILSNVGQMLISLVTFASMLYYLLVSEKNFAGTLTWLSPLSAEDNTKLMSNLKKSVMRIFVCSFAIGAIHSIVTYVTFSLSGIDLCLILSFISGFAAMLPVFSSWIVTLPVCAGLLLAGQPFSAAIIFGTQCILLFYVDSLIYSAIPGNTYVIGLSIVFGTYTFGAGGILVGPLLAGLSVTFLSIYRDYISLPVYASINSPSPTAAASPNPANGSNNHLEFPHGSPSPLIGDGSLIERSSKLTSPQGNIRSHPETGSFSAAHSSASLKKLETGLNDVAAERHSGGKKEKKKKSGQQSVASTPVSASSRLGLSPSPFQQQQTSAETPLINRALRFNTPIGKEQSSAPTTPASAPSVKRRLIPLSGSASNLPSLSPHTNTTSISEGDEHDAHDTEHEDEPSSINASEDHHHPDSEFDDLLERTSSLNLSRDQLSSPTTMHQIAIAQEQLMKRYEEELAHQQILQQQQQVAQLHMIQHIQTQQQELQRQRSNSSATAAVTETGLEVSDSSDGGISDSEGTTPSKSSSNASPPTPGSASLRKRKKKKSKTSSESAH